MTNLIKHKFYIGYDSGELIREDKEGEFFIGCSGDPVKGIKLKCDGECSFVTTEGKVHSIAFSEIEITKDKGVN